jgi:hypothetical protein
MGDAKATENISSILDEYSIEHERLSGDDVHGRCAHFQYDRSWSAIYDPAGGILYADRCIKALQVYRMPIIDLFLCLLYFRINFVILAV